LLEVVAAINCASRAFVQPVGVLCEAFAAGFFAIAHLSREFGCSGVVWSAVAARLFLSRADTAVRASRLVFACLACFFMAVIILPAAIGAFAGMGGVAYTFYLSRKRVVDTMESRFCELACIWTDSWSLELADLSKSAV
jgi:hypothetical protein